MKKNHKLIPLPSVLAKHLTASYAKWSLGIWSFIESSIFPIPPDPALMFMALAQKRDAYRLALITTLTSVAGGVAGYAIGAFFLEDFLAVKGDDSQHMFAQVHEIYHDYGSLVVFLGGFTIIPYKVITIFSGAVGLNLWSFVAMSLLSRGLRFYLEAWFVRLWGEQAWDIAMRWLGWRMIVALSLLFLMLLLILKMA